MNPQPSERCKIWGGGWSWKKFFLIDLKLPAENSVLPVQNSFRRKPFCSLFLIRIHNAAFGIKIFPKIKVLKSLTLSIKALLAWPMRMSCREFWSPDRFATRSAASQSIKIVTWGPGCWVKKILSIEKKTCTFVSFYVVIYMQLGKDPKKFSYWP